MTIVYSADALVFDSGSSTWSLRPDYNPFQHRVNVNFSDDDALLDGDNNANETGDDTNQSATITDMSGGFVTSGQIYAEDRTVITDGTTTITMERLEIGGTLVGYIVNTDLVPGTTYSQSSTSNVTESNQNSYSFFNDVACFGTGSLIATTEGELPIEWLSPGDLILTRDHGAQPLRWIGCIRPSQAEIVADPRLWPVTIPRHDISPGAPHRPLIVTRNHRVFLQGGTVDFLFGEPEVLAAAGHLHPVRQFHASDQKLSYFHLLLDRHEVIMANGMWVESLLSAETELYRIDPRTDPPIHHDRTARRVLREWECRVLRDYATPKTRRIRHAA